LILLLRVRIFFMVDPSFFRKSKNYSVSEIANLTSCKIRGEAGIVLQDVSALQSATKTELSFFDNIKYKDAFQKTKAGACFVSGKMVDLAPEGLVCLVTDQPYKAYALAAQAFYPDNKPDGGIAESVVVSATASLGDGATIGHHSYIGEHVEIGDNVWVEPNVSIMDGVKIGDNVRIGAGAVISHAVIDDYVRLYPGVRIGQDGFGFAIDPAGHVKVPQLGRVLIGSHVEIGANTTIDRGAGPDTVIGAGTWIDNLVQIGHNVVIGKGCVIVAQVGISGSTKIQDYVLIGGQAGIAGHLNIGMGAKIGAQSGVMSDVPAGEECLGSPSFPKRQFFKQVAALNRLIKPKKSD